MLDAKNRKNCPGANILEWNIDKIEYILLLNWVFLWSGFINSPLQSLVNQRFSQTYERLFSNFKRSLKS